MSEVVIRESTGDDVAALHRLIEGAYRGEGARRGWTHEADLLGGQRTDVAALKDILADPAQILLLAEGPDGPRGCVLIADKGDGLAYLGMLTVDPALQGGGLGRRLTRTAEAETVRRFAARRMEMTVIVQRTELIAWYARLGYAATGEMRPFPMDQPRFGLPRREDLAFVVLARDLA